MDIETRAWLAGLLEGEGSFCKPSPSSKGASCISLQMTDEDIVSRVSDIFGVKYHKVKKTKTHFKQSFIVTKRGFGAIQLMKMLKPLMGLRRQQQIEEAIKASTVRQKKIVKSNQIKEVWFLSQSGLTQSQIAKKLELCRETVNRILNKKRKYGERSQLVAAPDCDSGLSEFDSRRSP